MSDAVAVAPRINELPNELLVRVLSYINDPKDVWSFLMTQRRWFKLGIDTIWMRPSIQTSTTLELLASALQGEAREYAGLIRRLNFATVAGHLHKSVLHAFSVCTNLERLALANASLEDENVLLGVIAANKHLSSIDVSGVECVTDNLMFAVAQNCPQLHGIYLSGCPEVTDAGLKQLTTSCHHLRRLKIANTNVTEEGLEYVLSNCRYMLELDISGLMLDDKDVQSVLKRLTLLRELRVNGNSCLTPRVLDGINACENLRLVDFGGCNISDGIVEKLVQLAPRLHQVSLGKCFNITDRALTALATLEFNLHYIHLGHCLNITNRGVAHLVKMCPRLQYVDVANCTRLTNEAVAHISRLPRLRRIGLVKCTHIDDEGILWLAKRNAHENTLERVHLSYCNNVSFQAVATLVNLCPRLTHLSLTGVAAFMRPDLVRFCRAPPPELTQHQQAVFCVFSGQGVVRLRNYINMQPMAPRHGVVSLFPPVGQAHPAAALNVENPTAARVADLAHAYRDPPNMPPPDLP